MSWLESLERFGDRLALVLWAITVYAGLAWVLFHPAVAMALQMALILFVVIRRFTIHPPESIASA